MRWLLMPLLALSCLMGTGKTASGGDAEIWYNPHVPLDWTNMWTPGAPWQNAAGKVQVLEIIHWWLDTATDAQILAITNFAKAHHMKLSMQILSIGLIPGNPCGHVVEGYSWAGQLTMEAQTLKRLGVKLDIITMDEPLYFGHYDTDSGACQIPIADLATNIAANLSGVLALYPQVQLYDIESVPILTEYPDWLESTTNFYNGLAQATGNPIRGVEVDVGWDTPAWVPALRHFRDFLHERNMRFGIIDDGDGAAQSSTEWVARGVQNYEYTEGMLGIIPDFIMFTTWLQYPQYNMPETSPAAQTWGINRYFRQRTLLQAQFVGQGVKGKLTTASGKPVVGATINGYVPGIDFSLPLPTYVVQGVVPSNAVYGLIGIRLNDECSCSGVNDVLVGTVQYQETQGGSASQSYLYTTATGTINGVIYNGEKVGGTMVTRLITNATLPFYTNSSYFPVTPGAHYSFTVPAATIGGEGWYGTVFLLWAGANHNGLVRVNTVPAAGRRLMSTATTAADGTFALSNLPRVGPGSAPVTVEFAGDDTYRYAGWTP